MRLFSAISAFVLGAFFAECESTRAAFLEEAGELLAKATQAEPSANGSFYGRSFLQPSRLVKAAAPARMRSNIPTLSILANSDTKSTVVATMTAPVGWISILRGLSLNAPERSGAPPFYA